MVTSYSELHVQPLAIKRPRQHPLCTPTPTTTQSTQQNLRKTNPYHTENSNSANSVDPDEGPRLNLRCFQIQSLVFFLSVKVKDTCTCTILPHIRDESFIIRWRRKGRVHFHLSHQNFYDTPGLTRYVFPTPSR